MGIYLIQPEPYSFKGMLLSPIVVVLTAAYLINRILSRVLDNKSLVEVLKSFYPHFRALNGLTPKVFGCTAFVHVHSQHGDKLDPRAIKCVFLGYSSTQKGYMLQPLNQKIIHLHRCHLH